MTTHASMSLDGFIADTNDQVGPLFDWYGNGDVEVTGSDPNMVFHVSAASAAYLREAWSNVPRDRPWRPGDSLAPTAYESDEHRKAPTQNEHPA